MHEFCNDHECDLVCCLFTQCDWAQSWSRYVIFDGMKMTFIMIKNIICANSNEFLSGWTVFPQTWSLEYELDYKYTNLLWKTKGTVMHFFISTLCAKYQWRNWHRMFIKLRVSVLCDCAEFGTKTELIEELSNVCNQCFIYTKACIQWLTHVYEISPMLQPPPHSV